MINFLFVICCISFFMLMFAAILKMIYQQEIAIEQRADQYFGKSEKEESKGKKARTSLMNPTIRKYWNIGVQQVSKSYTKKDQKKLDTMLRDAGHTKLSAVEFRLMQLLICIGTGLFTFLLIAPFSEKITSTWLLTWAVAFLGYRYPIFYLAKKKTQRVNQINKDMADFFDMVNLLLEAGVGLEGAISNVCAKTKGPLSEEFQQVLDEMKRGKSRREALYSLRQRVPSDRFQGVIMSIIQADQLGIGMAKVIRNLTSHIREQQREAAREQAMKAPVKMLFPMVIFIFPSLFIVILGPMVVKLIVDGLG